MEVQKTLQRKCNSCVEPSNLGGFDFVLLLINNSDHSDKVRKKMENHEPAFKFFHL